MRFGFELSSEEGIIKDGEFGVAFAIATVLLLLTAAIELLAAGVQKHFERKKK